MEEEQKRKGGASLCQEVVFLQARARLIVCGLWWTFLASSNL